MALTEPSATDEIRDKLLQVAYSELGTSDTHRYWQKVLGSYPGPKLAWCGVFALWCLHQLELCDWSWIIGKGFLYRLPRTLTPKPGDVAYFDKPYQHHALVQRVEGDQLYLIQGNYGVPGRVAESACSISAKKPVFYSIEQLAANRLAEVNTTGE